MFVIRTAFWLSLVILCLPAGENQQGAGNVGASEAFLAATGAISDIANMCERNPAVCETGHDVMMSFGRKARNGVQIVSDFLDENITDEEKPLDEEISKDAPKV
ncbi:MAG: DUF5330 domain-containing protein [Pseudomonadota bacterium]